MMKKKIAITLVFIIVMTIIVGCNNVASEKTGMVLKWNISVDPKSIDPQLNGEVDGGHVINNTFEGLMREVDDKLVYGMAESHEVSEDKTVYTFYLRDALWSDGQPVTAYDFEYAWKRACNPDLLPEPSAYAYQLFYIKGAQDAYEREGSLDDVGVAAIDEHTLRVELNVPTPYFLDLTTFYTYMPVRQDVVEKDPNGWARNPEVVVSNGPFVLTDYHIGENLTLSKNENYWQAEKVNLETIEGSMISEESTMLSAYEADDLDIIEDVPLQEIPRLKAEQDDFYIFPLIGTYYYIFNTQKPPFDDVKVRKALAYAIDRKAIAENITQGGEVPATGFTPPGLLDHNGDEFRTVAGDYGIDTGKKNIEKAKELLAEAGYPEGKGFPLIQFFHNTSESHKIVAEAIQEMWKNNLGIEMKISNQEWAVFQETRHNGVFDIATGGWLGDFSDPITMLDLWLSYSGNNDAHWDSSQYDALIESSKVLSGEERFGKLYEAEKLMMNDMIVAPIYYYTDTVMIKDRVKNWKRTKLGYWFFGFTHIE